MALSYTLNIFYESLEICVFLWSLNHCIPSLIWACDESRVQVDICLLLKFMSTLDSLSNPYKNC
uniref:Uncharacterized protein n=1 Tax=Rhizophora mucronata TaxID=61149 RepID=A0A2P2PDD7_RHIMU